ncbi:helix-turn-helix domain-containing protein [Aeromicrobium sp.]|uniref:TetR/AcrR family transcriptional regulator n=1 Tax=Aeromicrobium sp. TaxID=1871063 RepID=UPI0028A64E44|nr:helix-turn-helix domain-containing protein [Aeromicrobium sp.]
MSTTLAPGPESRYLDAARECIVQLGWRRATLTDIARRAGVSRMTIYRRWPDTGALLSDLLVREWGQLFEDAALTGGRLADGMTRTVATLRENELFLKIIEVDPELLLPYLFERLGRNQAAALELLELQVRDAQERGEVRAGDARLLAQTLLLTTYGFVLSARTFELSLEELDAELRTLIERYLAP